MYGFIYMMVRRCPTLPDWQGYRIYQQLLQSILLQQAAMVKQVWISYLPENTPSGLVCKSWPRASGRAFVPYRWQCVVSAEWTNGAGLGRCRIARGTTEELKPGRIVVSTGSKQRTPGTVQAA
jgi:hypothetical protein